MEKGRTVWERRRRGGDGRGGDGREGVWMDATTYVVPPKLSC